jgi:hypothetical protein
MQNNFLQKVRPIDKGQQVFFENIVVTSLRGNRKMPMVMEFTIAGK